MIILGDSDKPKSRSIPSSAQTQGRPTIYSTFSVGVDVRSLVAVAPFKRHSLPLTDASPPVSRPQPSEEAPSVTPPPADAAVPDAAAPQPHVEAASAVSTEAAPGQEPVQASGDFMTMVAGDSSHRISSHRRALSQALDALLAFIRDAPPGTDAVGKARLAFEAGVGEVRAELREKGLREPELGFVALEDETELGRRVIAYESALRKLANLVPGACISDLEKQLLPKLSSPQEEAARQLDDLYTHVTALKAAGIYLPLGGDILAMEFLVCFEQMAPKAAARLVASRLQDDTRGAPERFSDRCKSEKQVLARMEHLLQKTPGMNEAAARNQARDDVLKSQAILSDYLTFRKAHPRATSSSFVADPALQALPSHVRRFVQIKEQNPTVSYYPIAMCIVDELQPASPPRPDSGALSAEEALSPADTLGLRFPLFAKSSWNERLEGLLDSRFPPQTHGAPLPRNVLIRRAARMLDGCSEPNFNDTGVSEVFRPFINGLREFRKQPGTTEETYNEEVLRLAEALINAQANAVTVAAAERLQESRERANAAAAFTNLDAPARELVAATMGKQGQCDSGDLRSFIHMDPAIRELKLSLILSSAWEDPEWRTARPRLEAAKAQISSVLDMHDLVLRESTQGERLTALLSADAAALRMPVALFFGVKLSEVTLEHLRLFAVWVDGDEPVLRSVWSKKRPDPDLADSLAARMTETAGRFALLSRARFFTPAQQVLLGRIMGKPVAKLTAADYKDEDRVSAWASSLRSEFRRWSEPTREERLRYWRRGVVDLLAGADFSYKARFCNQPKFTADDLNVAKRIAKSPDETDEKDFAALGAALGLKVQTIDQSHAFELLNAILIPAKRTKQTEALARQMLGKSDSEQVTAAELQELYQAMQAKIDATAGSGQSPKDTVFKCHAPEMLKLQAVPSDIRSLLHAARKESEFHTLLDFLAVSYPKASSTIETANLVSRPKYVEAELAAGNRVYCATNDDSASSVVITLHDGRTIILDAVFDGVGGHQAGHIASGIAKDVFEIAAMAGWIQGPEDVRRVLVLVDLAVAMEQISRKKYRNMFQENNMATTATIPYQCGNEFHVIHCGDCDSKIIRNGQVVFASVAHSLENELVAIGMGRRLAREKYGHIIQGVLGDSTVRLTEGRITHDFLHIDNSAKPYDGQSGFILQPGDAVLTCSDGISVPVCEHELISIITMCGGDAAQARDRIMDLAEFRSHQLPYGTGCSACSPITGKNDDRTLSLRFVKDGVSI